MSKILVLFHSWTTHVYKLAESVAEGATAVDGIEVVLKQVPEIVPESVLERGKAVEGRKTFAHIPEASVEELPDYDGFAFGTPTRFGNMSTTMRSFLDQTGLYYAQGTLTGRPATVFCSTGTGGGLETTITSFWNTLAHHGMTIVPLGPRTAATKDMTGANGGSPYGASAYAAGSPPRPSEIELEAARVQGRGLAEIVGVMKSYRWQI